MIEFDHIILFGLYGPIHFGGVLVRGTYFITIMSFLLIFASACAPLAIDYEQVSTNEKIIIRFSHVVGEDTPKGQAARLFAQMIKERTQGQVEVQVFPNSSLYKDSEELPALQQGQVQMIAPALSKVNKLVPELGVFDLPYLYPDLQDYHHVLDGEVGTLIKTSFENLGYKPIAFWDSGFKQFSNNSRPIHTPHDLANITMRTMPSSVLDQQFTLLNVKSIEMNFDDVYPSLEKKLIEGQENSISNIYTKRFYRVQNYLTISDHGYLGYVVLMSEQFWDQLSPDIQQIISTTMNDVTKWQRNKALDIEEEQLADIYRCECIHIQVLTDEQKALWKLFFQPLYINMEARLGTSFFNKLRVRRYEEED